MNTLVARYLPLCPLVLPFLELCTSVRAQEPSTRAFEPEKVVNGSFGVDFTTAYYFRGILQEN